MTSNPLSPFSALGPTSGSAPPPGSGRFKPIDPMRVLRQHAIALIVLLGVGVVLGGVTWYLLRSYRPRYTSYAQLYATGGVSNPYAPGGSDMMPSSQSDAITMFLQTQIARITSPEILQDVVNRKEVRATAWFQQFQTPTGGLNLQAAINSLAHGALDASVLRNTTLVQLAVSTETQNDAAVILGAITTTYLNKVKLETGNRLNNLSAAFRAELSTNQTAIDNLQQTINDFLRQRDLNTLQSSQSGATLDYQRYKQQEATLRLALDQSENALKGAQEAQKAGPDAAGPMDRVAVEAMPGIERRHEELRSLREQRDRLLARFGAHHYAIRDIDNQIQAVQTEKDREMGRLLRQRLNANAAQAASTVEAIKAQLTDLQPKIDAASARMTDINGLLNHYHQLQDQMQQLKDTKQKFNEAITSNRMSQQRPDAVPIRLQGGPTSAQLTFPKPTLVIPAVTILILALGVGVIFLHELLDQRVKSPADLGLLPDAEILGVVPNISEDPTGPTAVESVVLKHPTGLMAEAFRQVRTAILSKMDRRGYKTLVVTAPQAGSGASAILQNLAISLAYNGRRVLVLDANFRRPMQHRLFGVSNERGLIDALNGRLNAGDAVQAIEDQTLSVLPTGNTHDMMCELLEGSRFRNVLSELESQFDVILIDAPPALLAADTQLLAKHVDAIAMVVRAGTDKRGMIGRMMRQLDGHRADILGLVLNGVRSSAGGYFRKNYRDYYRYRTNGQAKRADLSPRSTAALESARDEQSL